MIAYLSGTIRYKSDKHLIVETHGVGYAVGVAKPLAELTAVGETIELFTHLVVRENLMELYGFRTTDELNFFKTLLKVKSIGPKTALGIMAIAPITELQAKISRGDPKAFEQYPGIGKKTAERLVLELKHTFPNAKKSGSAGADELETLVNLGYSSGEARNALEQVPKKLKNAEERVRAALKVLGS